MEEKESSNNNINSNAENSKNRNSVNALNTKKLQASLFAFSESMPNLLAFSPRSSGVSNDSPVKAVSSPPIVEGI